MGYIVFENNGTLDPRSIKTFGMSAKEGSNPIGYFGTGLKYALAILIRENQDVKILTGKMVFDFKSSKIKVRNKDFDIINMNDEELPFTTELGKNWELWQAFREIYCNCLDEGGYVYESDDLPIHDPFKTQFIIKGREFQSLFHMRDTIVLNLPSSLVLNDGDMTIYNKPSNYVYYRGIRVHELENQSLFTYNINCESTLTEDRTLKHPVAALGHIPRAISGMVDRELLRKVLCLERGYYENDISFGSLDWNEEKISNEFVEVLGQEYKFNNDKLNKSARDYFTKRMKKNASKHYETEELTRVEQIQLDRCTDICKRLFTDFDMYGIMVVKTLGQETMALADMNERKMVISKQSFRLGTKFLLSTMIEEYAHLKTGYYDQSRELQTWLFDSMCTIVEDHVILEPI